MQFKSKRAILVLVALLSFGLFGCDIFGPNGGSNQAPVASFTASRTSGEAPLEISFNASNSYDPDGSLISYEWDFGDGDTGAGETVSHTYSTQGTYTVTLTVTDDDGTSDQDTVTINVEEPTGETIYVDDDLQDYPEADYTKIQDAIDAASDGYTIKVYPGTYNEEVYIRKQLTLIGIGEPIVKLERGFYSADAITIDADYCTVDGFYTVSKAADGGSGIMVYSNGNTISNNTTDSNDSYGIFLQGAMNNTLFNNTANSNGRSGILFQGGSNLNTLYNNTIKYNGETGIGLYGSNENTLFRNKFSDNGTDIWAMNSNENQIYQNDFMSNGEYGKIYIYDSSNIWRSPDKVSYTYQGNSYTKYLGNYYDDYSGSDADGDGIGDNPYIVDSETNESDNYPLVEPIENYNVTE